MKYPYPTKHDLMQYLEQAMARHSIPAERLFIQSIEEILSVTSVKTVFCMLVSFHRNCVFTGKQADIVQGLLLAYPEVEQAILQEKE